MSDEYEQFLWERTSSDDESDRGEAYYLLAEKYFGESNYDRALTLNEQARSVYTGCGDSSGVAQSRLQTARILIALDRPLDAMPEIEWCSIEYRADVHEAKLAEVTMVEARAFEALGEIDKATDDYRASLNLYISDKEADLAVYCANQYVSLLFTNKRYQDALAVFGLVEPMLAELQHSSHAGELNLLRARVELKLGDSTKTFEAIETAQAIFEYTSNPVRVHYCQALQIKALRTFGRQQEAIDLAMLLNIELKGASSHYRGASKLRMQVALDAGDAMFELDELVDAQDLANETLLIAKATHHFDQAAVSAWQLARIALAGDDFATAERYLRMAIEYDEKVNAKPTLFEARLALASIFLDREEGEAARIQIESFDIDSWLDAKVEQRQQYFLLLAQAYWWLDNLDQVSTLCDLVFQNQLLPELATKAAANAHDLMGQVCLRWGNQPAAAEEGRKALGMALELGLGNIAAEYGRRWLN